MYWFNRRGLSSTRNHDKLLGWCTGKVDKRVRGSSGKEWKRNDFNGVEEGQEGELTTGTKDKVILLDPVVFSYRYTKGVEERVVIARMYNTKEKSLIPI